MVNYGIYKYNYNGDIMEYKRINLDYNSLEPVSYTHLIMINPNIVAPIKPNIKANNDLVNVNIIPLLF